MIVSVQNCDTLEFVKQFCKGLNKIPQQKDQYLRPRVNPKKWCPHTSFKKNGRLNQIFCMQ